MLTLCVITKNEERHLHRCLSSCASIVDQIVIVDSGSTDETLQIARQHQANIHQIDWRNDYSYARNIAIDQASEDWILFLDADEFLVNPKAVVSSIKKAKKSVGGFVMERKDAFYDLKTGKYCEVPVGIVRLFRNYEEIRFEEPVHEIVGPSILRHNLSLQIIHDAYIHHNITAHSKDFLFQKQDKYLNLINKSLQLNSSIWLKYQKAKTLWFFDRKEEALELFIEVSQSNDTLLAVGALNNMGALFGHMNESNKAIESLTKSLNIDPNQSQSHFLLGDHYLKLGKPKKAISHFFKVKSKLGIESINGHIPGALYLYSHQKLYRLALCYYDNAPLIALILCRFALKKNHQYVDALLLMARLFKHKGLKKRSDFYLNKIKAINPEWQFSI